jgi:hypothetical protein
MGALNDSQINILRALSVVNTKEEEKEIKDFVIKFLAKRMSQSVDASVTEKNYTKSDIEEWQNEHFRATNK